MTGDERRVLPRLVGQEWCPASGCSLGLAGREPLGVRRNGMLGFWGYKEAAQRSEWCSPILTVTGQVSVIQNPHKVPVCRGYSCKLARLKYVGIFF